MEFILDHIWKPIVGHYYLPLIVWGSMILFIAASHLWGKLKNHNKQA